MTEFLDEKDLKAIENSIDNNELPEAPLSVHIDGYFKGFHVGMTIRSEDNRVLPVSRVISAIDEMISKGFEPSWNKQTSVEHLDSPINASSSATARISTNPVCGIHHVAMIYRQPGVSKTTGKPYNGFWACPEKNPDGSYCTYKPEK